MKTPAKIPGIVRLLGQGLTFRIPNAANEVFVTFDDGPIPLLTPWILDCLDDFGAKASFFLVGENVLRYPELVARILNSGHKIGNHTHNHISGFKTKVADYLKNTESCQDALGHSLPPGYSRIFRPPYGQISPRQAYLLKKQGYQIIMWDVLSKDYDPSVPPEACIANVLDNIESGSIIVMHDNLKAEKNIKDSLPSILSGIRQKGFGFGLL